MYVWHWATHWLCYVHNFQECSVFASPGASTCCGPIDEGTSCICHGPDGILSAGDSFKLNSTDICTVCTCLKDITTGIDYLECYEPVCPEVSGCPADQIYYPDDTSCCPLCRDQVPYDCTGTHHIRNGYHILKALFMFWLPSGKSLISPSDLSLITLRYFLYQTSQATFKTCSETNDLQINWLCKSHRKLT